MSWGGQGAQQEWLLPTAIEEAAAAIAPLETEWDQDKLSKKLKEYFNKGAKNINFKGRRGLAELINEYADNALGSLFAGLGDREWLFTGQADFLLCMDAGIKDLFPGNVLRPVPQLDFEQMVLASYERAFEEQRFGPILSEAVPQVVTGPKIKKKVWNCCDAGRKEAVNSGSTDIEEFTQVWINSSIANLSEASQGSPESTMTPELAVKLFVTLLEGSGLPLQMVADGTAPPVHLVEEAIASAYQEHTKLEDAGDWEPPKKKQKGAFSLWG
mmetsp:Transcript_12604/g.33915  ORF Transcript_12604/g.33915 Transcript_12604/m.33915 type:complete len:271 (+) Transcript_12604:87-899(+)